MVQKARLASLPDIDQLKRLSQSLAMLDAIMSPDWEYRYYSFNSSWGQNETVASMRDGSGDDYFILFNTAGAIIKGFAHESPMGPQSRDPIQVWSGILDDVPSEFQDFLTEPAFEMECTTFCIWRRLSDLAWQVGEIAYPNESDPDGSDDLLSILHLDSSSYQNFAAEYYESEIPLSAIEHVFKHKPLLAEIISDLNPDVSIDDLKSDINEIGYPATAQS